MRKELKKAARQNLKKHYWLLLALCLFAGFLGIEYGTSFFIVKTGEAVEKRGVEETLQKFVTGGEDQARQDVKQREAEIQEHTANPYLEHSRGVFSSLLNSYSSGSFILTAADGLFSIFGSKSITIVLLILGSMALHCFVWLFLKETYRVIMRRMVLESRTYEKVPMQRFLYPIQSGQWARIAWNMFVKCVYQYLWSLTVIGGVIKKYSYQMAPYILAENPKLTAKEAITLSRCMMNGHKWESFTAGLSFLGWDLLNGVTLGLSGIFFSNPYEQAFYGEYYVYVREDAKRRGTPGSELIGDVYLYEKAETAALEAAYPEIIRRLEEEKEKVKKPGGFGGWLSEWFGIILESSPDVSRYEKQKAAEYQLRLGKEILERKVYPGRMAPVPAAYRMNITSNLMPMRSYTVLNLISMFFIFSFIGWVWEVSLHLITSGEFVNRGVLHGPWLPIYGSGGVLILILLKKLRENPTAQFVAATALCGCVEYFTAWYLEVMHGGAKWWDYSGYFLNLHGRICAEGLLVFGLGGLAIVYLIAPSLDNLLKRVNKRVLTVVTALLLLIYIGDQMYSSKRPNAGEGITSVQVTEEYIPEQWSAGKTVRQV